VQARAQVKANAIKPDHQRSRRFAGAVGEILTAAPHLDGPPLPFRHCI